jgi:hypothetical protein
MKKLNSPVLIPSLLISAGKSIKTLSLFVLMLAFFLNAASQEGKPAMKLGAYYYAGWGGKNPLDDGKPEHAWAKGLPEMVTRKMVTQFAGREPLWGWRDGTKQLMEKQIDLAADNGLAYFAFCWYWADNRGPINTEAIEKDTKHLPMQMFMKAGNNRKMEFCLLVANHEGFEILGAEAWKQAADYWITLFKHPRYLKVDGKPLLIIFSPGTADADGLAYLQKAAREAGLPGVAVACNGAGKVEDGFSLRTNYGIIAGYGSPSERHLYKELYPLHEKEWHGTSAQPYIPVATSGWDRRPWEAPDGVGNGVEPSWYYDGRTPEAFGHLLEMMRNWMDNHPDETTKERLATIYAWNEIGEGGYLVPTKDDPQGEYLKEIRKAVYGK